MSGQRLLSLSGFAPASAQHGGRFFWIIAVPVAAPKPCSHPGCGVLVRDGTSRCPKHPRENTFADSRRGSRHERGYGADWDKRRVRVLRRDNGLCQCEDCKRDGRVLIATEVDHKVSKAEWKRRYGTLAGVDDDSNLGAINKDCHKAKTQREAAAARAARAAGG